MAELPRGTVTVLLSDIEGSPARWERDAVAMGVAVDRHLRSCARRSRRATERVFQLLHPDLPAELPPLRSLASRPSNLPLQQTPFLGREEPAALVVGLLLRDDVRLLTITVPGGVG